MSEAIGDVTSDWFASAFDALYPVVYAHRTVEAARPECEFAAEKLRLHPNDRLLDLCCGNGRHLVHMLKHTSHCTGLDFSRPLLRLAVESTRGRAALVRADMRKPPFREAFSVVVNFFTSFGYFAEDEDNDAAARALARMLKPGGRFMIDFLNVPHVEETLKPESERFQDGYRILEKRWIDERLRRVNKSTVVEHNGVRVSMTSESVRLYDLNDLESMLGRWGLEICTVYGNYQGEPLTTRQPRMILIGRKKHQHA
jgi:ubiquinone/menaquinone biosynthesis C-methylase UbiE